MLDDDYGGEEAATKASEKSKRRPAKQKSEDSVSLDEEDARDERNKKHW